MLSRKYYEQFAVVVADSKNRQDLEERLMRLFERDNPRFSRNRFHSKVIELRKVRKLM